MLYFPSNVSPHLSPPSCPFGHRTHRHHHSSFRFQQVMQAATEYRLHLQLNSSSNHPITVSVSIFFITFLCYFFDFSSELKFTHIFIPTHVLLD
jgi:hypothetical protein